MIENHVPTHSEEGSPLPPLPMVINRISSLQRWGPSSIYQSPTGSPSAGRFVKPTTQKRMLLPFPSRGLALSENRLNHRPSTLATQVQVNFVSSSPVPVIRPPTLGRRLLLQTSTTVRQTVENSPFPSTLDCHHITHPEEARLTVWRIQVSAASPSTSLTHQSATSANISSVAPQERRGVLLAGSHGASPRQSLLRQRTDVPLTGTAHSGRKATSKTIASRRSRTIGLSPSGVGRQAFSSPLKSTLSTVHHP